MFRAAVLIVALVAPAAFAAEPSWIEESNRHAQILLDVMARYNAESACLLRRGRPRYRGARSEAAFSERQEADLAAAIASSSSCAALRPIRWSAAISTFSSAPRATGSRASS